MVILPIKIIVLEAIDGGLNIFLDQIRERTSVIGPRRIDERTISMSEPCVQVDRKGDVRRLLLRDLQGRLKLQLSLLTEIAEEREVLLRASGGRESALRSDADIGRNRGAVENGRVRRDIDLERGLFPRADWQSGVDDDRRSIRLQRERNQDGPRFELFTALLLSVVTIVRGVPPLKLDRLANQLHPVEMQAVAPRISEALREAPLRMGLRRARLGSTARRDRKRYGRGLRLSATGRPRRIAAEEPHRKD